MGTDGPECVAESIAAKLSRDDPDPVVAFTCERAFWSWAIATS